MLYRPRLQALALSLALIVALATIPSNSQAQTIPARCDAVVQIGSWNIEWLGRADRRPRKRNPDPAELARYVAASGVDVLALNEISVTHRAAGNKAPRNQQLDAMFRQLDSQGARWQYRLFAKRDGARDPDDQWLGLAWNEARVQLAGGPWSLPVKVDAARERRLKAAVDNTDSSPVVLNRWPQATLLRVVADPHNRASAKTALSDFLIVPIHLKSNRGGEQPTAQIRDYEVELMLKGLQQLQQQQGLRSERDLIILGDSNMLRADEPGNQKLQAAGLKDCNSRDLRTYIGRAGGAPFDRVFIASDQKETSDSCAAGTDGSQPLDFKIVRPSAWRADAKPDHFADTLSDHQLIRVGVCVMADDD